MTFIRNPKDFWAGILYIAFGVAAITVALKYPIGSAGRMGPGYFPRALGILLIAIGLILSIRSFRLLGTKMTFGSFKPRWPAPMPSLATRRRPLPIRPSTSD